MDLKNISNIELTSRLEKLVRSERKLTHMILCHILEIENRRIYAELGFDGMFSYLTKGLGYSESAAYRRLQSARLLKKLPALSEKIEGGSLNLSQLTAVEKCLKVQDKASLDKGQSCSQDRDRAYDHEKSLESILIKIENKNSFETKKILAVEFDQLIQTQTFVTPQKDESVKLELILTKEQFAILQEVKSQMSHSVHDNSMSGVIEFLALKYLKARTGFSVKKTKGNENIKSTIKLTRDFAAKQVKRSYLPVQLKRSVMKSAEYRCQYIHKNTGQKCDSRYQLQIDHIRPVSKGGLDAKDNLQILCRTHNQFKGARI